MHSYHQGGSQSYHLIWKPDWNVWASKIIWSCKSIPCRLLDWWSLFLAGCWPEANLSSLPCESSLFACFIKASKGDSATKTKMRTFWNLITEVASLQHWGIALVSSKLLMGRELHKARIPGGDYWRWTWSLPTITGVYQELCWNIYDEFLLVIKLHIREWFKLA